MNAGRFVLASVVVFVVRFLLNGAFYGYALRGRYEELNAAHPGMFREVIPAYAVLDLIAAFILTYLVVKASSAFGGGIKGGVTLGVLIAILGPVLGSFYYFFSVTYYPADLVHIEAVYLIITYAIQGAVAAALYKNGMSR